MSAAITPEAALAALRVEADSAYALEQAAYHKTTREVLGLRVPRITELASDWRQGLDIEGRLALADALWQMDIHETRIAAAKLMTQARLYPDDAAWDLICRWLPDCDGWAIADHLADAGSRRLVADPARLDQVEGWTRSRHLWTKRAALVFTLPWAKLSNPKPEDLAQRDRILGWAAAYVADQDWFIQKAVAWWIRDLSKREPEIARAFLDDQGNRMKAFARKEASKYLGTAG